MLSIQNFQIRPLPLIVFGVDSSLTLATHVFSLQRRSALIVTDRGLTGGIPSALREILERDGIAV